MVVAAMELPDDVVNAEWQAEGKVISHNSNKLTDFEVVACVLPGCLSPAASDQVGRALKVQIWCMTLTKSLPRSCGLRAFSSHFAILLPSVYKVPSKAIVLRRIHHGRPTSTWITNVQQGAHYWMVWSQTTK